jgi:hypothetical protein
MHSTNDKVHDFTVGSHRTTLHIRFLLVVCLVIARGPAAWAAISSVQCLDCHTEATSIPHQGQMSPVTCGKCHEDEAIVGEAHMPMITPVEIYKTRAASLILPIINPTTNKWHGSPESESAALLVPQLSKF